ncbi:MAG: hypothetical protein FJ197_00575 [Gammaproteobacteria bacterium]|nr:hypothetical protein [Gammaproteobacteria bacterium]
MNVHWQTIARRSLLSAAAVLMLGAGSVAQASHDSPQIAVEINTPRFSTRFATHPYWGGHYYGDYDDCPPPPRGYYRPGYWEWNPPQYYSYGRRHDHRHDHRHWDDRAYRHDHGKHRGWSKHGDRRWDGNRRDRRNH